MTMLLHLSDTHFGTEQSPVVEALVTLARKLQPELVVVSGDITQRARAAQFHAARTFIDRLGAPWLAIPGNHDIALFDVLSRLWRPYARFNAAFGDDLEPCYDADGLLVLGVKTTRRWRHKHGQVSASQVERVAARLRAARDEQLRVVVVHQPMVVPPGPDKANLLIGHLHARRTWAAAGADLILGGHIHLPYVLPVPEVERVAWVVQAGTAISSRVRPGVPNSVNVVTWERELAGQGETSSGIGRAGGRISVQQWDYQAASSTFELLATTQLVPESGLAAKDLAR